MAASKILIVEDEDPIREMIAFHLGRAGYETLEAADCGKARELLVNEQPDLALIDWMLPDMSGLELTRMLKRDKNNNDLAIIMLTARADDMSPSRSHRANWWRALRLCSGGARAIRARRCA
jgi:two-component system phosphate regulon response regulator PhoB